jgi:hypothetical protein
MEGGGNMPKVELQLTDVQYLAVSKLAADQDVTLGQILRSALTEALKRDYRKSTAKKPVKADEQLVAPLRALLADDFAYASSWDDLQSRLKTKGFTLQESGGGLILCRWPSARRICKGSELGQPYRQLARKFRRPFPGHRQPYIATNSRASLS